MAISFIGGGNRSARAPFEVDMKAKRLSWVIRVCWKFVMEKLRVVYFVMTFGRKLTVGGYKTGSFSITFFSYKV
jgi:hypothetical protein